MEVKEAVETNASAINIPQCVVGFIVAAFVGICAIKLVDWLVKSDKFKIFAYYTFGLGAIVLVIAIIEMIIGHPVTVA